MGLAKYDTDARELSVIGHLLAGGEMVPAQMPSASNWTSEKKLAAAVLAQALVEVRDRHDEPTYRQRVAEDLAWIFSDDTEWPYAFIPLCHLFGLEPEYVRGVVRAWLSVPTSGVPRQCSAHRHAA
jgi:hypothetical protein